MNTSLRRIARTAVLLLVATSLAACHFHRCHPMPRFPHPWRHCR